MIEKKSINWVEPLDVEWSWDEEHENSKKWGPAGMWMRLILFMTEYATFSHDKSEESTSLDEAIKDLAQFVSSQIVQNLLPCPDCGNVATPVRAMEGHFLCKNCAWGPEPLKHFDFSVRGKWFSAHVREQACSDTQKSTE